MSLIGTLTSGVSAMRAFTKGLEVIGSNIANVNTVGYKSSTVNYSDTFSNTLRASAPSAGSTSNTSATQVGTGVQISQISMNNTQGSLSTTGLDTDLGISGNGYFIVKNASGQTFATRAGNFRTDDNGYLVTTDGYNVQGLVGGTASVPPGTVGNIKLKSSDEIAAEWSTNNATSIHVADVARDGAQAAAAALNGVVTSTAADLTAAAMLTDINTALTTATAATTAAQTSLAADPTNQTLIDALAVAKATSDSLQAAYTTAQSAEGTGTAPEQLYAVTKSLASSSGTANAAAASAVKAATAAATPSQRTSFSIDKFGNVFEFYGNGSSVATNQILLQNFNDPSALLKEGNNLYSGFTAAGPTSGTTTLSAADNTAGSNGLGSIKEKALELANVDLTDEFANMITTQRSFQASSRMITVSDTLLEDIVNLKR
jgi:flagellar hook protein FlgE